MTKWKMGKTVDSIIAETPDRELIEGELEYYGGQVIAESMNSSVREHIINIHNREYVPFNINDHVKFKLNALGIDVLVMRHQELSPHRKFEMPHIDEEGYITMQMWDFIQSFGEYIGLGFPSVLLSNDILIEDTKK